MLADNDLALGRVIEAISKSKFWSNTAIFVVEDDARMLDALHESPHDPRVAFLDDPRFEDDLWRVREAGLGATAHVPGHRDTFEGWEDSAVAPDRLPELTGVIARACAEAIETVTGLETELKFPNDVLVGGRKVAGILAEARESRVVAGIGVNVNIAEVDLPTRLETPATSLLVETRRETDRAELLVELLERIERRYDAWL